MNALLDFKKIGKISKALADPHRLEIIEAIKKHGSSCMQCSAVIDMINLSQPAISHHLKLLAEADLIIPEKEGRSVKYTINKVIFRDYATYLKSFEE